MMTDMISLIKPRITALVLITTASGLYLAKKDLSSFYVFYVLFGTALLVAASNALNMYFERETDAFMKRTQDRPLPAKRLDPRVALWFGLSLAFIAGTILVTQTNRLTFLLGSIAFLSYVFLYTPLKQKSHIALLIGAIPGALPPLMGWTAATGSIGFPGLILFFILFLWQIPHFLAIALLYQDEYAQAGIRIRPLEKGVAETKHTILRYSAGLVAISFYPVLMRMTGPVYLGTVLFLNFLLLTGAFLGLRKDAGSKWARYFFYLTILYLPLLLIVLVVDSR